MKLPLTILFSLLGCLLYAQPIIITGFVTCSESREPIPGVIVSLRPEGENRIMRFATTNAEGRFELHLTSFPENYVVHFAMMSYASKTLPLVPERQEYNAQLSMQATELREVRFIAPSIEQGGDTITYHVENFAEIQDQTLADVLKRMPGITVEPSGEIKYQDQRINRFYIEGRDMLGSRYGIATNTIHQKDVSSVEVMENHQPIRALQDISFSEDPALNIRLREDAKARWVGTVRAGTGFEPWLWKSELAAMRFKAKTQTLNIYKSNNTGDALANEIRAFSTGNSMLQFRKGYSMQDYIRVSPDNLHQIDDYRSRFNKTHLFSSNNLWSVGEQYDLTSQVSYLNKRLDFDNSTNTSYFLEDGTIITEAAEEHAATRQNRLLGDLTLTANTPTYYFRNKLLADVNWNDIDIQLDGTFPNTQEASVPHQQFSNDLEILRRFGNSAYRLNSYNIYQAKPQHLTVNREGEVQRQEIESSAFYTNTYTSLSQYINPVNISMTLGVRGLIRSMESELTGVADTLGRMNNDETMRYLSLYASPSLEYKRGRFDARLNLPLSFVPYRYFDKIADKKENEEKLFLSPRLFMQYRLTSRLTASLSGSYVQSPLQEQSFHEGLILNNYRNLSQGVTDFETGNSQSLSFMLRYRQPLKALFWNAGFTRSWTYAPHISNVFFLDPYLLNTFIWQDYNHNLWMLHGNISKGVDAVNGMLSLRSSFTRFEGATFQNEIESPYESDTWSISPKITSRPAPWMNLSYEFSFSQNWLEMKNTGMKTSYQNMTQKFTGTINHGKAWYIKVLGEHYYNEITANQSKHFFLADAEFTYRLQNGFEFNVSVRNIFNQDVYAFTTYSGLREMRREYVIRPRNVMTSV
ncbi:MAG: hypothetical protein ACOC10_02030, partial [Bacteroidota bacterium]